LGGLQGWEEAKHGMKTDKAASIQSATGRLMVSGLRESDYWPAKIARPPLRMKTSATVFLIISFGQGTIFRRKKSAACAGYQLDIGQYYNDARPKLTGVIIGMIHDVLFRGRQIRQR
jgi:hypothetical protein